VRDAAAGIGATATTGAAESRIALEIFAASAPVPANDNVRLGAEPAAISVHRNTSSTGMSAPNRSRTDVRARWAFRSVFWTASSASASPTTRAQWRTSAAR
jgi:hypothetical protein